MSKVCKVCQTEKEYTEFNKHPNCKDGHLNKCKGCEKLYKRQYYNKNRERISKEQKDRRPPGSQVGSYKKVPVEKRKIYARTKYLKDRESYIRRARAREQNLHKSTPDWLTEDHKQEIANIYWLARDLSAITGEDYHVDHIVPLKGDNVSGLHVPWNLQVLPADINLAKGNSYER